MSRWLLKWFTLLIGTFEHIFDNFEKGKTKLLKDNYQNQDTKMRRPILFLLVWPLYYRFGFYPFLS